MVSEASRGRNWAAPGSQGLGEEDQENLTGSCTSEEASGHLTVGDFLELMALEPQELSALNHTGLIIHPLLKHGITCPDMIFME